MEGQQEGLEVSQGELHPFKKYVEVLTPGTYECGK